MKPNLHGNQFSKQRKCDIMVNMMSNTITEFFVNVETTKECNGYFCSVAEAITIVIPGCISGLKNVSQIHQ